MIQLVDLVVQGIRCFSEETRKFSFKPGFNLILGGSETGKSTLFDCIIELLFPDRFVLDENKEWISYGEPSNSRAGLTIKLSEEGFCRIVKDFKSNQIILSIRKAETGQFERISTEPVEISAFLADKLKLPVFEDYKVIFLEREMWLPSRAREEVSLKDKVVEPLTQKPESPAEAERGSNWQQTSIPPLVQIPGFALPGQEVSPLVTSPIMPGAPHMGIPPMMGIPGLDMVFEDGMSLEEKEKRLSSLKEELARAKQMEELQFEIDGFQAKIFEISAKKDKVKKIDIAITQADEILDKYHFFRNLPDNIDERLENYKTLDERKAKELEKIDKKSAQIDEELYALNALPKFHQHFLFKVGAGLSALGIAGVVFASVLGIEVLNYLGILLVGGIGALFYLGWISLSQQGRKRELKEKLAEYDEQRKQIIRKFEVEGAIITNFMKQAECEEVEELAEKIKKFRDLEEKRKSMVKKKKELMVELDWDGLTKEEEELKEKIQQLELKLKEFPVLGMDIAEMRKEAERLEREIEFAKRIRGQIPSMGIQPMPGEPLKEADLERTQLMVESPGLKVKEGVDASKTQMAVDALKKVLGRHERLLSAIAGLFKVEEERLFSHISSRVNLYLQALSLKKYQEVVRTPEFCVQLMDSQKKIPFNELGDSAKNLVYFSLKLAVLELVVQKFAFPIIMDDPFLWLDENRLPIISKSFKRLSEKTQVIFFSSQKAHSKFADHTLNL